MQKGEVVVAAVGVEGEGEEGEVVEVKAEVEKVVVAEEVAVVEAGPHLEQEEKHWAAAEK